jgi:hypothetical protein
MRLGQKNGRVRQWARKGSRPRQKVDQRYDSTYVFGAVCPQRDVGAALVLPYANTQAMQLHLNEIATKVIKGAHAVVLLDKAAWHTTKKLKLPASLSLLFLPPCCPELNAQENIWEFLRQNYLSNRVFPDYDHIVEVASWAWNRLTAETGRIASIATRQWAVSGQ